MNINPKLLSLSLVLGTTGLYCLKNESFSRKEGLDITREAGEIPFDRGVRAIELAELQEEYQADESTRTVLFVSANSSVIKLIECKDLSEAIKIFRNAYEKCFIAGSKGDLKLLDKVEKLIEYSAKSENKVDEEIKIWLRAVACTDPELSKHTLNSYLREIFQSDLLEKNSPFINLFFRYGV